MAVRFAVANGNYSNPAIWDNGAVPLFDDIVYPNGFTVDIDQDIILGSSQNGSSPVRVPDIATPVMNGPNSPSGVASASTINGANVAAWNAFDQNSNTLWLTANVPTGWIQYQFPSSKIIKRYAIFSTSITTQNPRNWTFEGSNNGSSWTVLHTVTLGAGLAINTWYDSGDISNSTSYLYYRLNITLNGGSTILNISEFQMTESSSSAIGTNSGGGFTISTNRTITCTNSTGLLNGNATALLTVTSNPTININSNIRGGLGNAIRVNGPNYNITINGNVNASNQLLNIPAINRQAAGQMTIIGDIYGGASQCVGVLMNDIGTLNVIGNVYGTNSNANNAAGISITLPGTINITGNVTGGLFNNANNFGIISSVAANINITGNVIGGPSSTGNFGINLTGASILNITGNVIAGTGTGTTNNAINTTVSATITVNGLVTATAACNAIQSTSFTANTTINGIIQNVQNRMAFYGPNLYIGNSVTQWKLNKPDNSDRTLYSADTLPGVPSSLNVRQGTVYGPSNDLTGSLAVPPSGSVALGVPVDDGVGTAMISITDMGALIASYIV